ncbi:50S ribosomal protein L18 [Candidatus Kuenenbacteria bacterium CG23_combo_of_CG06-09_8_20_14_all_36_9]|uniref:Large ribosomal subunit protein uL18 n=1 Tax=Candidatus Kuenenbacteria bacterium CG10_big_fil_rev_8_21_14_0_10_36_11 TaxID=1974618 RepID=A0A2M6W9Q4_9BACT|nr:MAG: 50S ribosomal protein L18 [Candidatus Kuenenbacteria bacterium CG23_combo_of_CG06-09_8_20_14_all_36_9]PIT89548.1 MAG: 50S ribosomal protein L18 [Candidatus Kuenenbacteria bacterium CG10_big_fil_rev_8_21_14_0_10_36_11]
MNHNKFKQSKRIRRHARVRAKIFGAKDIPRLSVYKSLNHIYAQLIDDKNGKTLVSSDDKKLEKTKIKPLANKENLIAKTLRAYLVGKNLGEKALEKKITTCVFDKSHYKYHGRLKALADGARDAGLKF